MKIGLYWNVRHKKCSISLNFEVILCYWGRGFFVWEVWFWRCDVVGKRMSGVVGVLRDEIYHICRTYLVCLIRCAFFSFLRIR